jgi:hypothetical protein
MDPSSTYEYVASPRKQPAYRFKRALMIIAYVLYVVVLLIVGMTTKLLVPMLALIPLSLWIIVFFTWRYVSVEYEYSLTGGVMTVSKIFGGRTRKRVAEIAIKDVSRIAPFEGDYIAEAERYAPERTVDITADLQRPNVYFALYETAEKRRGILYFEATEKALRILNYYNRATVVKRLEE